MSALGPYLRRSADGLLLFECPGCGCAHAVRVNVPDRPCWTFNGDELRPTFKPSILVEWTEGPQRIARRCHSFVTDGRIQFLSDCTHALAGQTVNLAPWDTEA